MSYLKRHLVVNKIILDTLTTLTNGLDKWVIHIVRKKGSLEIHNGNFIAIIFKVSFLKLYTTVYKHDYRYLH